MTDSKSRVVVLGVSSTGEQIPAAAGRISTQPGNALEVFSQSQDAQKNAKLIRKVTLSGHNSTVEHTVLNLAFNDVSVFVEQYVIEYRLASYTVKSRRYVDFSDQGYYLPEFTEEQRQVFVSLVDSLFVKYNHFTEQGVPKEDARFLLPYCFRSNFYCTMNARELLYMLRDMLYGRGSRFAELLSLGEQLRAQLEERLPGIMTDFESRSRHGFDMPRFDDLLKKDSIEQSETFPSVTLVTATKDAERTVITAALTEQEIPLSAFPFDDTAAVKEAIRRIESSTRPRALETAVYTFCLRGVSLPALTHFTRHRIQSLSIPSLDRTVAGAYILPSSVEAAGLANDYRNAFEDCRRVASKLRAMGVPAEKLVYLRMSGTTIDFTLTMNARELLHFMKLRTCNRAQWEIREIATEMLRQLRAVSPAIFDLYGPSCYIAACPEGRLSCGRQADVKVFFNNLK